MNRQIPLNALRTFEAVATRLSFSAGAEALNVTPAAVSSQIRSLEELLGAALFLRSGRKVTLTDAGRTLLPGVQSGLAEISEAVQSVHAEREQGVLNVSMLASFLQKWLTPRLHEFYRLHPNIDLRINGDDAPVDFQQTDFHAAIRFGRGKYPGLRAHKLLDDWAVPVCNAALFDKYGPLDSI
jgi:LysR family glycine cleavage system transcriptional activator